MGKKCDYCGMVSVEADKRGGCLGCGAPKVNTNGRTYNYTPEPAAINKALVYHSLIKELREAL